MSAPTATEKTVNEKPSTVPFRYRARMEKQGRFGAGCGGKTEVHKAVVKGRIHPEPYDHPTAVALAQEKLRPLVDLGFQVISLIVTAYSQEDA